MKISVDQGVWAAHGDCVVAAPELFDLGDDDDVVQVLDGSPGPGLAGKAITAAGLCPVAAITIEN